MKKRLKTADEYFDGLSAWKDELERLRKILLVTELTEELKWGAPCYTYADKNVVGIAGFKSYFGLWFHQGALLKDSQKVLLNAQEGKTKALRQWRMTSDKDIKPSFIKAYAKEAIALAKAGKQVPAARNKALTIPPQLAKALQADKTIGAIFKALSPGQKREFADYITEAKREDTKLRRLKKILPMIKSGAGLNDKYR